VYIQRNVSGKGLKGGIGEGMGILKKRFPLCEKCEGNGNWVGFFFFFGGAICFGFVQITDLYMHVLRTDTLKKIKKS